MLLSTNTGRYWNTTGTQMSTRYTKHYNSNFETRYRLINRTPQNQLNRTVFCVIHTKQLTTRQEALGLIIRVTSKIKRFIHSCSPDSKRKPTLVYWHKFLAVFILYRSEFVLVLTFWRQNYFF